MTGFGASLHESDGVTVQVELRSVNNRHLKLSCRLPEGYAALESKIESVVREQIRRGAVQLNLDIHRQSSDSCYRINSDVLCGYYEQLSTIADHLGADRHFDLTSFLELPGVIDESEVSSRLPDEDWPVIEAAVRDAVARLSEMRRQEGAAMAQDLRQNCQAIREELVAVERRSPDIVKAYEERLIERINLLLSQYDAQVGPADIVKEVGVFADRVDVAEEIVRLGSHLSQFESIIDDSDSAGRKLEFVLQEMNREANTIGSKASNSEIAKSVVEIKSHIERLREMIQNVE